MNNVLVLLINTIAGIVGNLKSNDETVKVIAMIARRVKEEFPQWAEAIARVWSKPNPTEADWAALEAETTKSYDEV